MSTLDKLGADNLNGGRLIERTERVRTPHLAHHLSSIALRQWEKALTGIVAAPAAVALTAAAVATYGVALIERAFEVFESAIGEVGRAVTQEQDDFRQRERSVDRVDART